MNKKSRHINRESRGEYKEQRKEENITMQINNDDVCVCAAMYVCKRLHRAVVVKQLCTRVRVCVGCFSESIV